MAFYIPLSLLKFFRLAFYITLLVVTVLALVPQQAAVISTGWDKANHCIAFAVLLALFDHAYPSLKLYKNKFFLLLLYGVLLEAFQAMLPGRFASVLDIIADVVGLVAYTLLHAFLERVFPARKFVRVDK